MDLRKKIDDIFADYQRDLGRLVSIPSVLEEGGDAPFGANIQRALEEVLKISEELGFRTFIDPNGYN